MRDVEVVNEPIKPITYGAWLEHMCATDIAWDVGRKYKSCPSGNILLQLAYRSEAWKVAVARQRWNNGK